MRNTGTLLKTNLLEILLYMDENLDDQQTEVGQLEHFEYVLQSLEDLLSEVILKKKIPNQHMLEKSAAEQVLGSHCWSDLPFGCVDSYDPATTFHHLETIVCLHSY